MDYRNAARCFGILHRRSQAYIVQACEKLQLTFSEYVLLLKLYENEGISQEDMASLMYVDKAVVARTIKSLEVRGFVHRIQGKHDKRVKRIYTTVFAQEQEEFLQEVLDRWITYLSGGVENELIDGLLKGFQELARRAGDADLQRIVSEKNGGVFT